MGKEGSEKVNGETKCRRGRKGTILRKEGERTKREMREESKGKGTREKEEAAEQRRHREWLWPL